MAKGRKTGGRRPGSVNKVGADVRQYASTFTAEAIDGLVALGRTAESEQARVAAWREVLDRGCGKPPQAVTDADGGNLAIPGSIAFIISQQLGAENRA